MTIATDLATDGFHATDCTNKVAEAIDYLDVYYSGTLAEGSDDNWDAIIKALAKMLLIDQISIRKGDAPNIKGVLPREIRDMITALKTQATVTDSPQVKFFMSSKAPNTSTGQHWRDTVSS